jgi:hypothetical protein
MGGTPQASLQAAMAKLAACNGDDFWVELIDGLDAAPPIPTAHPPTEIEKRVSEAMSAADARGRESRLKCLGWLTRRSDIRTSEEWHEWLHQTRPPPLAQRSLLAFVLAHPDALEHGVFLRRVVPHHLGTIPDDCVPLYERMVREGSPTGRHFACMALLLYTDKTDSVPVTIDLIEEGQRGNLAASSDWGPIDLLRTRFAVNYFWDTDAWRDWWAGNHDK